MSETLKDLLVDVIVPVFFASCGGFSVWLLFMACQDARQWRRRYED